jgi:hypothetical protein
MKPGKARLSIRFSPTPLAVFSGSTRNMSMFSVTVLFIEVRIMRVWARA